MRVDFPKLDPVAETTPEDYLVSFYQGLGWDRASELDPKRVVINPGQWQDVCGEFNQSTNERTAGLIWMNWGPSTDAKVPYGKVEIEDGAFSLAAPGKPALTEGDKAAIDETVSYFFDTEGNTAFLTADQGETNEFLLQPAYDSNGMAPQGFLEALQGVVDVNWEESIDLAVDSVLERNGIYPHQGERYDAARDYLTENYGFVPPYDHYFNQDMNVNVLIGTEVEKDLDFSSIGNMRDHVLHPDELEAEDLDNGLVWLVNQQGRGTGELEQAIADYREGGFDACEKLHGPFLASVASELDNFPNVMGTVTVLAKMSICDMAKALDPDTAITFPKNATVGVFAPWVGGGSTLDIQLEKPLDIPHGMCFDMQIEGAGCSEYTVNQVYGLVDEAWKRPVDISGPLRQEEKPLDDLKKEAKERVSEKNAIHLGTVKERKPPEIGLQP